MKRIFLLSLFFIFTTTLFAQPFADLISASCQTFSAKYKDPRYTHSKNRTDDYNLNFFLPKVFKNGNTFMLRLNTETMNSTMSPDTSYSYRLSAISLPVGFKFVTKNKKWETILIAIPKLASDFRDKTDDHDFQMGGIFLEQFVYSDNLKIKAGLYYNREAFGNFFMPLVGVDWKINDRLSLYGVIPSNYWGEYIIVKKKLYTGINFKSFTRSFSLSEKNNYDYVRYNEEEIKLFLHYFVYKKILLFAEAGYNLGKNPMQYVYGTKTRTDVNPVYTQLKGYPLFNFGIAYRMRFDVDK